MSKNNNGNNNVISLNATCLAEACKKKPQVAGFCEEHFTWFKEGLVTKEGIKPIDFDKKFVSFMKRKKTAA